MCFQPGTEQYGIASFVYRAARPFHLWRLNRIIDEGIQQVLRANGFLWLATANDEMILFTIEGQTLSLEPHAAWMDADKESHPQDPWRH